MNLEVNGAKILFHLPGGIQITETHVTMWICMFVIFLLCKWLTHNLQVKPASKRQIAAEYLVNMASNFVKNNMGEAFKKFTPFIVALFSLAAFSSISSLFGLFPSTADLNTTMGWAIMVFVMIMYYKLKTGGLKGYLKGLTEPFVVLTPFNIIGEFSTPISMGFRMFGNAVSGIVISALLYGALAVLSSAIIGWIPGFIGTIPIFQLGIPAVLSIYFDLFTGVVQAFIFCMLTMLYISSATE